MAVAFDTTGSGFTRTSYAVGDSNTTLTINVPANAVNGDLLIAVLHCNSALNPNSITAPGGWTQIASNFSANGNFAVHTWIGWRIASSEPSSYDWTIGAAGPHDQGWMFRVTGHDSGSPIDVTGSFTSDAVLNPVAPAITIASANAMAVWVCGGKNGANLAADDTSVKPTAATQIAFKKTGAISNAVGSCIAYELRESTGSTGTRTFSGMYPSSSGYSSAIGFAIKEGTGGGSLSITSVTPTDVYSQQVDVVVAGTKLSNSAVVTFAGAACTGLSASSSTSLKITMPDFYTNNIKVGTVKELKIIG